MRNVKRYLLLLILLSSCNTYMYKCNWGYQKYPFHDPTHWQSYFSNKIVGNPPSIKDLEDLIL